MRNSIFQIGKSGRLPKKSASAQKKNKDLKITTVENFHSAQLPSIETESIDKIGMSKLSKVRSC